MVVAVNHIPRDMAHLLIQMSLKENGTVADRLGY